MMAPALLFAVDRKGCFTLFECQPQAGSKNRITTGTSLDDIARTHPALVAAVQRALGGEAFTELTKVGKAIYEISYAPTRTTANKVNGMVGVAPRPPLEETTEPDPETTLHAL